MPILKSAANETPIERPSVKLWMKSPTIEITANDLNRFSCSASAVGAASFSLLFFSTAFSSDFLSFLGLFFYSGVATDFSS
jgi:hypothetical protein